jgi:POT family proton-dependent oligopeptide transporter/mRNA interferase RelE/StbE
MVSGYYDLLNNYHLLFYICLVINILGLLVFIRIWNLFSDTERTVYGIKNSILGLLILVACMPLLYIGFQHSNLANNLILAIGAMMSCLIFFIALRQSLSIDKNKLMAFLILSLFSIVFWTLFFVGPMGVTYFLKNNIEANCFGVQIPPQWIMNLNSIFVIFGSPLCILILSKLRSKGLFISIARQFWLSILFIALSFFVLSIGINYANTDGLTSMAWVIAHFLLQALGELLIGPVGYAMVGKLVPHRYQGIMMGAWMMVSGVAATISQHFSVLMTQSESLNPLLSNADYLHSFNQLGLCAVLAAIPLYFLIPKLDRCIAGKEAPILCHLEKTA